MIQLTRENTQKATQKAIAVKPRVRKIEFGFYLVTGTKGDAYLVNLRKEAGRKLASCDCKGATRGVCYHIAAAIGLHTQLAAHLRH